MLACTKHTLVSDPSTFLITVLTPACGTVAFPPTMLEHFLVFRGPNAAASSSEACDTWAGSREHPSSLLPLCQPRARQLHRSEEGPLMPTFMQYVAFLSSYIDPKSVAFWVASQLLVVSDMLNHSWLFWFNLWMQRNAFVSRSKSIRISAVCVH